MNITIYRNFKNALYTEGKMHINGGFQTYTLESTTNMLPEGNYIVRIVKKSARKQYIGIFATDDTGSILTSSRWKIGIGSSFIHSKKRRMIIIGIPLIRGAMYKSAKDYNRITDRLMKCITRREPITLTITESRCRPSTPTCHWLR